MEDRPLSNTTGAVLDPVFSLRRRVSIPANQTVRCCIQHRCGALARRSAGAGGQVPRSKYLRTRTPPRLDQGASRDDAPKHRLRRSAPLPTTSGAHPLLRSSLRPRPRAAPQHEIAVEPLGLRHQWRPAIVVVRINKGDDLSTVKKLRARSRVPALQRTHHRSRDPQRHADRLFAVAAQGAGNGHSHQRITTPARQGRRSLSLRARTRCPRRIAFCFHAVARVVIVYGRGEL